MPQETHSAEAGESPAGRRSIHGKATPIPLGILLAATLADLASALAGRPALPEPGYWLLTVGLAVAVGVLIVGIFETVRHGAWARQAPWSFAAHAALALLAILLFAAVHLLRAHPRIRLDPPILALEAIALVMFAACAAVGWRRRRRPPAPRS